MNRGALQGSPVHQMVGGSPIWWDLNNMRPAASTPPIPASSPSTVSSSSSSLLFPHCPQPSSTVLQAAATWHDSQEELPESWSQLLLGGLVEEEERCSYASLIQAKRMESWEDHQVSTYPSASSHMADAENEQSPADRAAEFVYGHGGSSWNQILPNSSPRSCVTTSFNNSSSSSSGMLDFSNGKAAERTSHPHLDPSSECNSTPTCSPSYKKARVQGSSAKPTFKVRKEKLGDRITALHQLVSPFGKTDTASVLLEAIGYVRFLQSQIEALSSPYLATDSGNNNHSSLLNDNSKSRGPRDKDGDGEPKKDLRSRGLCLVPVSFTMCVGNDNAADYWAPAFGGGFR